MSVDRSAVRPAVLRRDDPPDVNYSYAVNFIFSRLSDSARPNIHHTNPKSYDMPCRLQEFTRLRQKPAGFFFWLHFAIPFSTNIRLDVAFFAHRQLQHPEKSPLDNVGSVA